MRLIRPKEGVRDFKGILGECSDGMVELLTEDESYLFSVKDLSFIRLDDVNFDDDMEVL